MVAGEVYFGTATIPAFYKLAPDGTLGWVYRNPVRKNVPPAAGAPITENLRGTASDAGSFSSALVAGGAVYFADTGGWMYCLEAATGVERWKMDSRAAPFPDAHWNNILMASPILADGKVVFAGAGVCREGFEEVARVELEWFNQHLKPTPTPFASKPDSK